MIKISPSILGADFADLKSEVQKTELANADSIHFDIMDRHFVPNLTFGPLLLKAVRKYTKLPFSVHLMVENPDLYVDECIKNGASLITVHQETCHHLHRTLSAIREKGAKAGVALNPSTPLSFFKYVANVTDEILIMTVNPGFSGQKLIKSCLGKIEEAKRQIKELGVNTEINVDGGVNEETIESVIKAGADTVVMASAFYGSPNPKELVSKIKGMVIK